MQIPTLYHRGKSGAIFQWTVSTEGSDIVTTYGQVGGAMQTARKTAFGKNLGRSNETSPDEQAESEALAMHSHKLARKYSKTAAAAQEELFLPMPAQDFQKHGHKVTYPVSVQPKLDGFRCLAKKEGGVVSMHSRAGKLFDLPHIEKALNVLPNNCVIDGELYLHGQSLQTIASWVKKARPETVQVGYHIYDVPIWKGHEDVSWTGRHGNLCQLQGLITTFDMSHILKTVRTELAHNEADVMAYQAQFIADGYEGAMVRTHAGLYQFGYRSYDLLKVKSFQDSEFEIVAVNGGRGKFEDQAVFTCLTKEGKPFEVVPRGTTEERRNYLALGDSCIGKFLTVKYFKMTDGNIPFLPVGLRIREDFDN